MINHTCDLFGTDENIHKVAVNIHKVHVEQTKNNVALKSLEKKRAEVKKASENIMRAIEMGVVTEMTATRLRELEAQLLKFDFLIEKEKQKTYASISIEDIENYLRRDIFNNREDMKVRKMIVNTFIREIVLFEDRIVITYNFKNNTDTGRHTPETVEKMLSEVDSAYTTEIGSSISLYSEPKQKDHRIDGLFVLPQWCGESLLGFSRLLRPNEQSECVVLEEGFEPSHTIGNECLYQSFCERYGSTYVSTPTA